MSVTEPVDVLLTDREKVPDIRARSLSERRDNIYPVGVKLYCRQVFEVRSTEKACASRDARLVRPWCNVSEANSEELGESFFYYLCSENQQT